MTPKFKDLIRRTQAYWYVDGLVEFGTGMVFFALGIILILESITPSDSNLSSILSFFRNAILVGGTIGNGLLTGLILVWQARGLTLIDGKLCILAGPGVFFINMGSCLLISGELTLRNYLKSNQPLNGEAS